jgi:DNA helicase-2/ATP-dependent DNA helicase PcrA
MNMPEIPDYLASLNDAQREAVLHTGRPLLILAGAGSGKTRVITTKIAYCIRELGVPPWAILAVTFTNKAAREMATRAATIEPAAAGAMLKTFHSFGAYLLRRNADYLGLSPHFTIYDDTDATTLLETLFPTKNKDTLKRVAHMISRAKDMNLPPDSPYLKRVSPMDFQPFYDAYQTRLAEIGNVDFGDLIMKPLQLLQNNPDVRDWAHRRWRVIMVDEYQDTNIAQAALLRELVCDDTYVCVVGDDDQSIYRFRGAEVRNILEFPSLFHNADVIKLETNYRSTSHILDVASSVVRRNKGRNEKNLVASRGTGAKPVINFVQDSDSEAVCVADMIQRSVSQGDSYADWAILYRTNAQSLAFENEFVRDNIPYKIVGSLKFYDREEIKDAIALLSFMVNPRDEISFRRIVNKPTRGLGTGAIEKILSARSPDDNWSIEGAMTRALLPTAKARQGASAFLEILKTTRSSLNTAPDTANTDNTTAITNAEDSETDATLLPVEADLSETISILIKTSGLAEYHKKHDEVAGESRVANLQEFVNTAGIYPATDEGLQEFLEHIELDRSLAANDDSEERVTLITLHNTKGLEFKCVVMTGMEQGLFPRGNEDGEAIEEERRLFYVGVTRAKDALYFTAAGARRLWGRMIYPEPSQFLFEADRTHLEMRGRIPASMRRGGNANIAPPKKRAATADGAWHKGQRVFSEKYGYGEVVSIEENTAGPTAGGEIIRVRFEHGAVVRFLSKAQGARFTKIAPD